MSLYKYQLDGIEKLFSIVTQRAEKAAMLCDPPGAGKTPQAIGLLNRLTGNSALIICPASLKENWSREIKKWSTYPLSVQILNSSSEKLDGSDVVIISYNLAVRMVEDQRRSEILRGGFRLFYNDRLSVALFVKRSL